MRDAVILGVACVIAILVGGWLFFLDSKEASAPTGGAVEVRILDQGQYAGIEERKNYRIRSLDELQQLWNMVYGPAGPAIPGVDFAKDEVLAVFDGSHSTGGYSVEVESVQDTGLARVIQVIRTAPGTSCITTEALTSPFQMVVVPKTDLSIQREERMVIEECQ